MAPTPRRSTRASTVARSVVSQSGVSAVPANSATPGRATALPKVNPRKSTAYGASGRISTAEEMKVPVTGFAQAFESQRGVAGMSGGSSPVSATGPDSDMPESDRPESDGPRSEGPESDGPESDGLESDGLESDGPRSEGPRSDYESEEEDYANEVEDYESEVESVANTSKSFGMMHEAGMLRDFTPPPTYPSVTSARTPAVTSARTPAVTSTRTPADTSARTPADTSARTPAATYERTPAATHGRTPALASALASARMPALASARARPVPQLAPPRRPPQLSSPHLAPRHYTKPGLPEEQRMWRRYSLLGLLVLILAVFCAFIPGLLTFKNRKNSDRQTGKYNYDGTTDSLVRWVQQGNNLQDEKFNAAQQQLNAVRDTVSQLKDNLPDFIIVGTNNDGTMKISDEFWNALAKRMSSEGLLVGSSPEWEAFLARNKEKIVETLDKSHDASNTRTRILDRDEFRELIEENWTQFSDRVDKKIYDFVKKMEKEVKEAVTNEVPKAVAKEAARQAKGAYVDQIRLHALALTNLAINTEIMIGQPNYFATGLGAVVDMSITSPTLTETPGWLFPFSRFFSTLPERRPPVAALEDYSEIGDCWCAAHSTDAPGQAQLGIQLGFPIFPKQITIEHIPMKVVPFRDVRSAPKNVELWAYNGLSHAQGSSVMKCKHEDMPAGWVCLGSVRYDIWGSNNMQTFDLDVETPSPIKRAIVRVTENWGANGTCIYRVRLHGRSDGVDVLTQ
ncbi:hypothetical protein P280DRAFT_390245 [Massarina eburnea CBS 473.64]|uniref:SUN domain-containing protein n=1 Tax=Massarina eburnea CBS 473.64 TaxID=1395130 RepID=A0A6A6SF01_9PLEO|nr:hypothetical protein P280DRAFT_390245 [Massarina eburnea CBS 473.64]